ncbi:hypothetical protein [Methylobacterium flocculans]|uniref:hypothetical protein n=1 Tax=Methylobacterium flocculans TaxID=2984843 RepID=UPI0021F2EBB7|nr:hypothetical protein [Methylobacterium sp. FF17]
MSAPWTVEKAPGIGWIVSQERGTWFRVDQFGRVPFFASATKDGRDEFGRIKTLVDQIRSANRDAGRARHGDRCSEQRRALSQQFADALNEGTRP